MFPGQRHTPAVEPRSVDHRKQLHHPISDPEAEMFPGRRRMPTGDSRAPGVWTTGSFIQLIVAESQGLTDTDAWPVSR